MSLVGVSRMDRVEKPAENGRKVINVEAALVDEVNEYAEELEERFGFKPTFAQALRFVLKEMRNKKL